MEQMTENTSLKKMRQKKDLRFQVRNMLITSIQQVKTRQRSN